MDLEELRRISQVDDNLNDNCSLQSNYYGSCNEVYVPDRPDIDLSLLTPCEFCNRTFIPASLNKHRRGCYNAWLKQKDRDSKLDREKNKYQTPFSFNGERPILTIEQMLAKRRHRRLNWRLRHEEFMRAVHAARDYADAVANGNPLPAPPPPILEPDLKQCPHCQRRFHDKAIERHLSRCKEQSIRNNKERPSYQTMEAKRRLAVRLYYQPSSRPNSCLSMTNPPTPTSFSRPSSRQTDIDTNRNMESPNDFNMSRYSSMSAIENTDSKFKIPQSIFANLAKSHGRQTSRQTFTGSRSSQNSTPAFESRNSTPIFPDNYVSGRQGHLSTFSSRNPSRQSMVNTPIESQCSLRINNKSLKKGDIYGPTGNLKRSTSCVSNIRGTTVNRVEKHATGLPGTLIDNRSRGDVTPHNRKPFSCGRTSSKDSTGQREPSRPRITMNKSNENISNYLKMPKKDNKSEVNVSHSRLSSRPDPSQSPINKNPSTIFQPNKRNSITKTSKPEKIKPQKIKIRSPIQDSIIKTSGEKIDLVKETPQRRRSKHHSKLVDSETDFNKLKVQKSSKIMSESMESLNTNNQRDSPSVHKVRNEVQIRIKPHARPERSSKKENLRENSKSSNTQVILHNSETVSSKQNISLTKENDNSVTIYRKIDSKGEGPNLSNDSQRFVSNCNLTKAHGDDSNTRKQSTKTNYKEQNSSSNNVTKNLYQCRSIRSVSISDQNNATKFRSTISLQDSLNRGDDNNLVRATKAAEISYFCQECGHKFPGRDAKFCCSCGCKRTDISTKKSNREGPQI